MQYSASRLCRMCRICRLVNCSRSVPLPCGQYMAIFTIALSHTAFLVDIYVTVNAVEAEQRVQAVSGEVLSPLLMAFLSFWEGNSHHPLVHVSFQQFPKMLQCWPITMRRRRQGVTIQRPMIPSSAALATSLIWRAGSDRGGENCSLYHQDHNF